MIRDLRARALTTALAAILAACAVRTAARAVVYPGAPDLALTARLVAAGSPAGTFDSRALFTGAFATKWPGERARLSAKYGAQAVADCFKLLDFTVADALRIVKRDNVAVPAPGEATQPLTELLWQAGRTPNGRYDVGYMLEKLVSHPYHHEIMHDLDAHFGATTNGNFHKVLGQLIEDGHSLH